MLNLAGSDDNGRKKLFIGWGWGRGGVLCPREVVMAMEEYPGASQLFSVSRQRFNIQVRENKGFDLELERLSA